MQNRDASIELDWADGTYRFRLAWGGLEKIQEACGSGPLVIFQRLSTGEWKTDDIREVIRHGLLGGGNNVALVRRLIRDYVEERPLTENVSYAIAVLSVALIGAPEEESAKKSEAAWTEAPPTSPTGKSDLPQSTEPEL